MGVQPAEKLEPTYQPKPIVKHVETQQIEPKSSPQRIPYKVPARTGNKAVFTVTAYTVGDDFTPSHGITASGEKVREGRTLACPRSLPFGTEIYIPYLERTYVCTDRGGRIKAGKLDVYMGSRKEALDFGKRKLNVIIKRKGRGD